MRRRLVLALAVCLALAATAATALAISFTDVQANNPQIAGDPTSNTTARFPTNKQNEPTIAVNPVNASFLIAGAIVEQLQPPCGPGPVRGSVPGSDCSFFTGVGTDGVFTCSNDGATMSKRGNLIG